MKSIRRREAHRGPRFSVGVNLDLIINCEISFFSCSVLFGILLESKLRGDILTFRSAFLKSVGSELFRQPDRVLSVIKNSVNYNF